MIGLKFKSPGCFGSVELSYAPKTAIRSAGWPCDASIEIAGTDGIIWANHFYGKMSETPWVEVRRGKKYFSFGIGSGMDLDWEDAVKARASHFAIRAAHGTVSKPDIRLNLHGVRVMAAAIESSETGAEIHLS